MIIIYRSELEWCNFTCSYCFWHSEGTNQRIDKDKVRQDEARLKRILDCLEGNSRNFEWFFTPAAEVVALPHYQDALARLAALDNCTRVTAQTNLSWNVQRFVGGLNNEQLEKVVLWATFHPTEMNEKQQELWIERCRFLRAANVYFSVGTVAIKENIPAIVRLSERLSDLGVYMWINAFKRYPGYYTDEESSLLSKIDPYFSNNDRLIYHLGKPCSAGRISIYLSDNGDIRRCHWVNEVMGNLFDGGLTHFSHDVACPIEYCQCHVGHMLIPELKYSEIYGEFLCGRIPKEYQYAQPLAET